jgi:hypothetical protein
VDVNRQEIRGRARNRRSDGEKEKVFVWHSRGSQSAFEHQEGENLYASYPQSVWSTATLMLGMSTYNAYLQDLVFYEMYNVGEHRQYYQVTNPKTHETSKHSDDTLSYPSPRIRIDKDNAQFPT